MLIIGCGYHPAFQQIAFADTEIGEFGERKLAHSEEAEQFYEALKQRSLCVLFGEFAQVIMIAVVIEEMAGSD